MSAVFLALLFMQISREWRLLNWREICTKKTDRHANLEESRSIKFVISPCFSCILFPCSHPWLVHSYTRTLMYVFDVYLMFYLLFSALSLSSVVITRICFSFPSWAAPLPLLLHFSVMLPIIDLFVPQTICFCHICVHLLQSEHVWFNLPVLIIAPEFTYKALYRGEKLHRNYINKYFMEVYANIF